jgi:hypothetical protein
MIDLRKVTPFTTVSRCRKHNAVVSEVRYSEPGEGAGGSVLNSDQLSLQDEVK